MITNHRRAKGKDKGTEDGSEIKLSKTEQEIVQKTYAFLAEGCPS